MELILSTFGTNLNTDNQAFVVARGYERQRVPVAEVSAIQINKGTSITSDAVFLAIENEIPIVFMDKKGTPKGRVWSPKYGSISTIRKGQLQFTSSHAAVVWIREILVRKVANQEALIRIMFPPAPQQKEAERAIHRLEVYREKISNIDGDNISDVAAQLRGWEGSAARIYFEALNMTLPANLRFTERTQHPAFDPVNAFLNYGYGLLYNKVESALIMAGIDPYIGVLHRNEYNRPVLVYDVIEIYRIWIDYVVYSLACQNILCDDYYSVQANGSYWLESLGRRVLIQSVNDYLEDIVEMRGLSRSRSTHINLFAQDLAQQFKRYN